MPNYDYDIGIFGGGSAGLTVASGAAQLGAKTLLIEKEERLGGDCLHYGCVPSKTLIMTAKVRHLMSRAGQFGLPEIESAPVDFKAVAARIQSVIGKIQQHDSVERFCILGAKVKFGNAEFVDEHSIRLGAKIYSAKNWVIATGSSPAIPPIEGLDETPYLTNRDIFSLDHLPASIIFLGAGPIAIEMAQAFCRLGSKVTVIQRSGQILGREDSDMADELMNILQSEGVAFHLKTEIVKVKNLGAEREVVITKGGEKLRLHAEALVVAMGREGNVSGLGLEKTGVAFNRQGIDVDTRMRTSLKHIFAAGDVTGFHQYTHAAGYEGGIVVSNAIFHLPRKADYKYLPHCTYTDPEFAVVGLTETAAKQQDLKYSILIEEFRANDRSLAEGYECGKIKLLLDEKHRPAGVQIIGPGAGELLSEWVAALNGGIKLSAIASAVHPYPTLSEINKKIAGNFYSGRIFSDKTRKALKFFFDFKGRACG